MKMLGILAAVSMVAVGVCFGDDFRSNDWGDSPDQVRAVEGPAELRKMASGVPVLAYIVNLSGRTGVRAYYYFTTDNKLATGRYVPPTSGIEVFYAWGKTLKEKYGASENGDTLYTSNRYVLEKCYYGGGARELEIGVECGYFRLCQKWQTDRTLIALSFELYQGSGYAFLSYFSKALSTKLMTEDAEGKQAGF
jgi:hypothetical protein